MKFPKESGVKDIDWLIKRIWCQLIFWAHLVCVLLLWCHWWGKWMPRLWYQEWLVLRLVGVTVHSWWLESVSWIHVCLELTEGQRSSKEMHILFWMSQCYNCVVAIVLIGIWNMTVRLSALERASMVGGHNYKSCKEGWRKKCSLGTLWFI